MGTSKIPTDVRPDWDPKPVLGSARSLTRPAGAAGPLRVLHVHSGNLYGGVETLLATLARQAPRACGLTQSFALCFEGRLSRELAAAGAAVHQIGRVRLSRPCTVWRARRVLSRLLRRESLDLVVCHQPWPLVVFQSTVREAGLPIVLWMHMAGDGRHWIDRLARRAPPDAVVANSRFTAASVARMFPGTPIHWVYAPLEFDTAAPIDALARRQLRRSLDTPEDAVVVVQVGRLDPLKGHVIALEALAALRHLPGWVYWIVGGPQRPADVRYARELTQTAERLGIQDMVRFVGERTDVPIVLRAADVYCQPNVRPDAFGISFVEALAAGLPVVTSGIGGACEIVDDSCGVLTPAGDVEALATALRTLIADAVARARLGRAAAARPHELCSPSRQMARVQDILSSVAGPVGLARSN